MTVASTLGARISAANDSVPLVYASSHPCLSTSSRPDIIDKACKLIAQHHLPLQLTVMALDDEPIAKQNNHKKISQRYCQQLSEAYKTALLVVDAKAQLSLIIDGIRVAPEWSKLQRRIVSAGRKSELLLQAAKLDGRQKVLDATAGFGHDSLILASTGSQVTMLEQHPLLVLLLLIEQMHMATHKNWQKLMARLQIKWGQAEKYLAQAKLTQTQYDVIYLDPMFPDNSYSHAKTGKGAKVGKHMQALHGLIAPPSLQNERRLWALAVQALTKASINSLDAAGNDNPARLIVKRPISAPHLAMQTPDTIWQNDVLRFDGYFVSDIR